IHANGCDNIWTRIMAHGDHLTAPGAARVRPVDDRSSEQAWGDAVGPRYGGRDFSFPTRSGIVVEPVYGAREAEPSMPGQYPYNRGIYPIHYQYQPWMDMKIIGYGVASQLRERLDLL